MINKGLLKLDKLVDEATGTRSIYPLVEVLRVTIEMIKIIRELNDAGKLKGREFSLEVYNKMINNKFGEV